MWLTYGEAIKFEWRRFIVVDTVFGRTKLNLSIYRFKLAFDSKIEVISNYYIVLVYLADISQQRLRYF